MKIQDLRYCLRGAEEAGVRKHPQKIMRELGISYVDATPQSMGDQWWFWGCTWDAEILGDLPGFLKPLNRNPLECVGFGLSQEGAEAIVKAKAALHLQDAAPDLLEALEGMLEELREDAETIEEEFGTTSPKPTFSDMLQKGEYPGAAKAIKAIAKAKGEAA